MNPERSSIAGRPGIAGRLLLACGVGLMALGGLWRVGPAGAAPTSPSATQRAERPPTVRALTAGALDPRRLRMESGRLIADLAAGRKAVLTLDPGLQESVSRLLARYEVPYAGVVAVQPGTGRVLAYVSHSSAEPQGTDWVRDASAPAASVFKLVTAAALLENGLTPRTKTCYHGGFSQIDRSHLTDHPRDRACVSLAGALGRSVNAVFAKRATRHLRAEQLRRYASALGFGHALPFDVKAEVSRIDVPTEPLEFARAAAGFWHSQLSPLHGVMIAATIANRGRMMRPHLVREVLARDGRTLAKQSPSLFRAALERPTAELLARMMTATVEYGTARRTFFDDQGNAFLPGIPVAGKTGTLSKERPYRGYTWFVGFAPAGDPQIAVAALVVNSPRWRIKAVYAAREALRYYLVERPRQRRAAAR